MNHRRPTIAVSVPLSLLLQCLVARDTESVAIVRPRRFVVGLPPLVGRGRAAAVDPRDDGTATVVGYDGLCRPRFEDDDDDDDDGEADGVADGVADGRQHAPRTTFFDQYDVLLAAIVNINEQYESIMRKLAFATTMIRRNIVGSSYQAVYEPDPFKHIPA